MLECSEMALLNNHNYHQCFSSAIAKLISQLKVKYQTQEQGSALQSDPAISTQCSSPFYVLDVSEGFSLLSLIAACQGHVKAYSSVEKAKQQEVLKRLAQSKGISEQDLEFWLNRMDDEQGMLQRPAREKLWSAIILDCVETCGLIRQKLMEKASLARYGEAIRVAEITLVYLVFNFVSTRFSLCIVGVCWRKEGVYSQRRS